MGMPGIFPDEFGPRITRRTGRVRSMTREVSDDRIRIGRPGARSERRWPGAAPGPPDPGGPGHGRPHGRAVRNGARDMMARASMLWPAVRMVIRAVRLAHDEQVRMWECVLETSGAAPLSAAGPLRWVRSVEGYRLVGSHVPAQEPSETGR